jgi:hypothetical protein
VGEGGQAAAAAAVALPRDLDRSVALSTDPRVRAAVAQRRHAATTRSGGFAAGSGAAGASGGSSHQTTLDAALPAYAARARELEAHRRASAGVRKRSGGGGGVTAAGASEPYPWEREVSAEMERARRGSNSLSGKGTAIIGDEAELAAGWKIAQSMQANAVRRARLMREARGGPVSSRRGRSAQSQKQQERRRRGGGGGAATATGLSAAGKATGNQHNWLTKRAASVAALHRMVSGGGGGGGSGRTRDNAAAATAAAGGALKRPHTEVMSRDQPPQIDQRQQRQRYGAVLPDAGAMLLGVRTPNVQMGRHPPAAPDGRRRGCAPSSPPIAVESVARVLRVLEAHWPGTDAQFRRSAAHSLVAPPAATLVDVGASASAAAESAAAAARSKNTRKRKIPKKIPKKKKKVTVSESPPRPSDGMTATGSSSSSSGNAVATALPGNDGVLPDAASMLLGILPPPPPPTTYPVETQPGAADTQPMDLDEDDSSQAAEAFLATLLATPARHGSAPPEESSSHPSASTATQISSADPPSSSSSSSSSSSTAQYYCAPAPQLSVGAESNLKAEILSAIKPVLAAALRTQAISKDECASALNQASPVVWWDGVLVSHIYTVWWWLARRRYKQIAQAVVHRTMRRPESRHGRFDRARAAEQAQRAITHEQQRRWHSQSQSRAGVSTSSHSKHAQARSQAAAAAAAAAAELRPQPTVVCAGRRVTLLLAPRGRWGGADHHRARPLLLRVAAATGVGTAAAGDGGVRALCAQQAAVGGRCCCGWEQGAPGELGLWCAALRAHFRRTNHEALFCAAIPHVVGDAGEASTAPPPPPADDVVHVLSVPAFKGAAAADIATRVAAAHECELTPRLALEALPLPPSNEVTVGLLLLELPLGGGQSRFFCAAAAVIAAAAACWWWLGLRTRRA